MLGSVLCLNELIQRSVVEVETKRCINLQIDFNSQRTVDDDSYHQNRIYLSLIYSQ